MSEGILRRQWTVERTYRVDLIAFVATFLLGCALYFGLRAINAAQWIVTGAIVTVMIVYAAAAAFMPRLRVRLDQAGDNAYYLGLLFTLTSMAVALFEFRSQVSSGDGPSAGVGQIIANFGIALATTIAGIFLRVVLNQMRVDPADIEAASRIELSEAAKRVAATLESVSVDMARTSDELRQRTEDQLNKLAERAAATIGGLTNDVATVGKELATNTASSQAEVVRAFHAAAQATRAHAEGMEQATQRLRAIEPPPERLAARLEVVAETLGRVGDAGTQAGRQFQDAGTAAEALARGAADAIAILKRLSESAGGLTEEAVRNVHEVASATTKALEDGIARLDRGTARAGDLVAELSRAAEASRAAQEASRDVLTGLTDGVRRLTALVEPPPAA